MTTSKPLLDALALQPVDKTPVWIMRQAGRHLPEYRELRAGIAFQEAVSTPEVAARITLQPIERYSMDGAVIFADIMTPLEAMGVNLTFDPGPRLQPMSLRDIVELPVLDPSRVGFVGQTIELVAAGVPSHTAVIGFAGAPVTLLAYLLEGGGSKEFMAMRGALRADPVLAEEALARLAESMRSYLSMQISAGAEAVQLFDSWAGVLPTDVFERFAVPAAAAVLQDLEAPSIYFAPGAGHTLDAQSKVEATAYGVDWRTSMTRAFEAFPGRAIQGNLDPAVLLADEATIVSEVERVLDEVGGREGHVMNLGHGIDRHTPPENVKLFVQTIRS